MEDNSLALFTKGAQLLAEANTIQKAKELSDIALTAQDWARRKNLGEEAIQYCREYAFEAERRIGELLMVTDRAKGELFRGNQKELRGKTPTLAELGLTKKQSSNAQFLAKLDGDKFEEVKQGRKKVSVLKRQLKREEDSQAIKEKTFPVIQGKYKTILVDPPWDYDTLSLAGRGHTEYSPMTLEDLQQLDISQYAEENCHLYLWATNNFLYEALKLGEMWGFNYKTVITWVKPSIGMGSYFRNNTEQLLFFVRGSMTTRTDNTGTHFEAARGQHSEKPEIFYEIIERNSYPNYLEYFARKERKNWIVYGNINV